MPEEGRVKRSRVRRTAGDRFRRVAPAGARGTAAKSDPAPRNPVRRPGRRGEGAAPGIRAFRETGNRGRARLAFQAGDGSASEARGARRGRARGVLALRRRGVPAGPLFASAAKEDTGQ